MEEKLKKALETAISTFYKRDSALIQIKGTERSCVFRIGIYLHEALMQDDDLKGLSLDCEYNKRGCNSKILNKSQIRPDLIIHKRGTSTSNVLAIEIKGWWNKRNHNKDIEKLKNLTSSDYSYHFAVFVLLGKDEGATRYKYFHNKF